MSILVKGMKMPRFCAECALKYTCEESNLLLGNKRRATDCPLVEIPQHGRLIDADKLCEYARNSTVGIDANDICRFPCVIGVEEQDNE